jgi:hypothetical protein
MFRKVVVKDPSSLLVLSEQGQMMRLPGVNLSASLKISVSQQKQSTVIGNLLFDGLLEQSVTDL